MSQGPSSELRRKWREQLAKEEKNLIGADELRRNEDEYRDKHGYNPNRSWLVPRDWMPRRLVVLGPIVWVEYISRKKFEGPKTFIFHHDHELSTRPRLAGGVNSYGERSWGVFGGGYVVTPHGIEDSAEDHRTCPSSGYVSGVRLPLALHGMGTMFGFGYVDQEGVRRELDLSDRKLVLMYAYQGTGSKRVATLYIVPDM